MQVTAEQHDLLHDLQALIVLWAICDCSIYVFTGMLVLAVALDPAPKKYNQHSDASQEAHYCKGTSTNAHCLVRKLCLLLLKCQTCF